MGEPQLRARRRDQLIERAVALAADAIDDVRVVLKVHLLLVAEAAQDVRERERADVVAPRRASTAACRRWRR